MSQCPQCGASVEANLPNCKYCGEPITPVAPPPQPMQGQQPFQQNPHQQQPYTHYQQPHPAPPPQVVIQQMMPPGAMINPAWPIRSKVVAGVLGILLGGIGVHKFYLGRIGLGILYILFCWTFIPSFIGFIEGIIYLCSSDEAFSLKNRVRVL